MKRVFTSLMAGIISLAFVVPTAAAAPGLGPDRPSCDGDKEKKEGTKGDKKDPAVRQAECDGDKDKEKKKDPAVQLAECDGDKDKDKEKKKDPAVRL